MRFKPLLFDYFQIILGCFIAALGLSMFLVPNKVAAGGIGGIATVLHYLFKFPVGLTMLAFNIPLYLVGMAFLEKGFGVKTLLGSLLFSIFTQITAGFPVITQDLMLSAVFGGVIMGVGLGIVFKARGSTGGTALASMILNHLMPSISVGQGLLIIDFFVIILSGIAFDLELALYAWIGLFISSKVIDLVQEGFNYAKAIYIISTKDREISQKILDKMGRGVTFLEARGGFTHEDKNVILCVTTPLEVSELKNIVHQIDPHAFIIVHNVHEVLGEGFGHIINK